MVGNNPNYAKIDILRCFIRFNKNLGRQQLTKELELGEGTVRTILNILKSKDLVESTKKGHFLSRKGSKEISDVLSCMSAPKEVELQKVYPGLKKMAILMQSIKSLDGIIKLRDIAVKNGADGAMIFRYENRLYVPKSNYEQDYSELDKLYEFKKDDALILSFAASLRDCELGAIAIAIELSPQLKKFINEF